MNKDTNHFSRVFSTLFLIVLITVVIGSIYWVKSKQISIPDKDTQAVLTPPDIPTPISTPTKFKDMETEYIQLKLPEDWKVLSNNLIDVPFGLSNETYILTKNNYQIHINPSTGPTGGSEGGRFADLAAYTPSISVAVITQPSSPCEENPEIKINSLLVRTDLYISSDNKNEWCNAPTEGSAWYGSFVTTPQSGYYGEIKKYKDIETNQKFLITFGYEGISDINNLPKKGTSELNKMLEEMSAIVESIIFK